MPEHAETLSETRLQAHLRLTALSRLPLLALVTLKRMSPRTGGATSCPSVSHTGREHGAALQPGPGDAVRGVSS